MTKQHYNFWSQEELAAVYQEYMAGGYPSELAKRRGRKSAELLKAFRRQRWALRPRKNPVQPLRIPADLAAAMYADYQSGMTFADVERKHGRESKTLRNIFLTRGWPVREPHPNANRRHRKDGTWERQDPKTEVEIEAMIQAATKLAVPEELKLDWRKWSIEQRGDFIRRLRARLQDPKARPALPFSDNVIPFDYSSSEAWDIITAANGNRSSREWVMKMDLVSQGVIWDGRLWFWCRQEPYYYEAVRWTPERPRAALHRAIWESVNGPIPARGVVRNIDGNPNNLDPSNLRLQTKNDMCRENQARALARKSRDRTAILLNRHQTKTANSNDILERLASR